MDLRINRIAYPVTTLGPGRRIALWVQGCDRHCAGCASVDTWDLGAGVTTDAEMLAEEITSQVIDGDLDGLTITGGEPILQAESLELLLVGVRRRLRSVIDAGDFDILLFSGFPYDDIVEAKLSLLKEVDVAVCGPYVRSRPRTGPLVASDNQELVFLNENVRGRYECYMEDNRKTLQFQVAEDGVFLVGLPEADDLHLFRQRLAERGVVLGGVSWKN